MKILEPIKNGKFTSTDNLRNSIFLAGPCPRVDFTDDWRFEAFEILKELGFNGTVITPSNKNYQTYLANHDKDDTLKKQTMWEYETMKKCSALVFWIPRSKKRPARTTNIEFGDWFNREGVFIGWPPTAEHNEYLQVRADMIGKSVYYDLRTMLADVVKHLSVSTSKAYFTSDTHFSQERTFVYSNRPFYTLEDMDLTLYSNWNKRITMHDIVYHAGDFGEISKLKKILGNLNFGTLHWVLGNYDRAQKEKIVETLKTIKRDIRIYDNYAEFFDIVSCNRYYIVHEPYQAGSFSPKPKQQEFALYGHIHGRNFAKTNGFEIGTDYHNYTPISYEQVTWFTENGLPHWDKNVYCNKVQFIK